jgi:hypothetical protein
MDESIVTPFPFVKETADETDKACNDSTVCMGVLPSVVGVTGPCKSHQERDETGEEQEISDPIKGSNSLAERDDSLSSRRRLYNGRR